MLCSPKVDVLAGKTFLALRHGLRHTNINPRVTVNIDFLVLL